ncbi:hypothetical protein H2O64_14375 [Kordia sp. YSTF-M3]|uniref:Uncharacterized protein n=1 Tax=Kordia aestuariivivens TaxID=2759037 RepID=A0ABR7QBA9_9FLAO|nr:hypothetical protein [Kordia aestuariivivens]MBC8755860.1 hypothetical protein [Kordia aestuariivivens]
MSKQDVDSNNKLSDKMRSLATLQQGSLAESTYSELYNFTIDASIVKFVENVETNAHSYTFSISRANDTSSVLENAVFSYNETMDDYDASLITYHFTESQRQEFLATRHVNSPYEITYEPLAVNLSDILGEDSLPCTITYAEYHVPDGSRTSYLYSTNGHIQNGCEHEGANDVPCTTYTNIVIYCPPSGSGTGNGTDDNTTDPSTPSTTGGSGDTTDGDATNDNTTDVLTSPISEEDIVKQSILECINTFSFDTVDTTTIDPEILEQVSLTLRQWTAIINYLDENGCSEVSQEFAINVLTASENAIIDFDLELIIEINETVEFQNQTCLKSIKDDVIATKQISKIIKKFEPTYPVLHLEWGIFSSSQWSNTGQTSLNQQQDTAFLNFNSQSLSHVSNIIMVKTIVHEIIHAELYRKLKELVENYNIISITEYDALRNNYQGIAHYTMAYGNVESSQNSAGNLITWALYPDYSLAHHNQMASFYRETLIQAMKDYDTAKGITRINPEEFYEAISWAGLRQTSSINGNNSQYTDAWKKFKEQVDIDEANIPEGQRKYNRYENIMNQEYNSTGVNCN